MHSLVRARLGLLSVTTAVVMLSAGIAYGQGGRACESLTLDSPSDYREAYFVDVDGNGLSVGDRRHGQRGLFDVSGRRVGERLWSTRVLEVDDQGEATHTAGESMTVFEDGVVFSTFENRAVVDAANPETSHLPATGSTHTIIGGTGAFAGAQGTIETVHDGNELVYVITLECG